ncbi:MAG: hypothetical protein WBE79_13800 [Candidatus Cybelea sp.]
MDARLTPYVIARGSDFLAALAKADRAIWQDAETIMGRPAQGDFESIRRLKGRDAVQIPLITRIAEFMASGQRLWYRELLEEINARGETLQFSFTHNSCFSLKCLDFVQADEYGMEVELREEVSPETSLLVMARVDRFRIRRCLQDGAWFSPPARAPRPKFCTVQCRNRFNYQLARGTTMTCSLCSRDLSIDQFSGIAQALGHPLLACHTDPNPTCIDCVASRWPQWHAYLADADHVSSTSPKKHREIHRPMHEIPIAYWRNASPSEESV